MSKLHPVEVIWRCMIRAESHGAAPGVLHRRLRLFAAGYAGVFAELEQAPERIANLSKEGLQGHRAGRRAAEIWLARQAEGKRL